MGDNYVEQIVTCRPPKSAGFIKVGLVVCCVLSVLFILIPYVGFFLTAGVIVFTVIIFRSFDYEYEYSFMGGELDVDKIIQKSRRKRMNTFDFNRMELVAPIDSQEALRMEHGNYKTFDYTSNMPDARVYVGYAMCNNELVRICFEPNDKMLKELEYISPRKVIR
ncbi:MAG: DUF6106 family protein [Lachnospiraceae bacterium]